MCITLGISETSYAFNNYKHPIKLRPSLFNLRRSILTEYPLLLI